MTLSNQFIVSVEPGLAESFKAACLNAGVSVSDELSEFMAERSCSLLMPASYSSKDSGFDTRRKRRRHVASIILHLEAIRDHEDAFRANVPENLQSGPAYENAELAIDSLEQAIDLLKDAY